MRDTGTCREVVKAGEKVEWKDTWVKKYQKYNFFSLLQMRMKGEAR